MPLDTQKSTLLIIIMICVVLIHVDFLVLSNLEHQGHRGTTHIAL